MDPAWTNEYVGIPFDDHGRDRVGLDCWGLVRLVYLEQFGLDLPSYDDGYEAAIDGVAIAELYEAERLEWIEITDPTPGDVVVLRILSMPCHMGVVVDSRTFLHSMARRGTCLERLWSPAWRARVLGFYRHRSRS